MVGLDFGLEVVVPEFGENTFRALASGIQICPDLLYYDWASIVSYSYKFRTSAGESIKVGGGYGRSAACLVFQASERKLANASGGASVVIVRMLRP